MSAVLGICGGGLGSWIREGGQGGRKGQGSESLWRFDSWKGLFEKTSFELKY